MLFWFIALGWTPWQTEIFLRLTDEACSHVATLCPSPLVHVSSCLWTPGPSLRWDKETPNHHSACFFRNRSQYPGWGTKIVSFLSFLWNNLASALKAQLSNPSPGSALKNLCWAVKVTWKNDFSPLASLGNHLFTADRLWLLSAACTPSTRRRRMWCLKFTILCPPHPVVP